MARKPMEEIDAIEITNAVAEEIAAELIAEDIEKEHAAEVSAKQEREQLIAEACKMAGRVEAFGIISKFADVSNLLHFKKMKEDKIYKDMPGIGTWENFCISVGISSKKVDEDLRNLDTFGSEFLLTVSNYGIGYRELRQLKRAKSDGMFAISSDSVIIEGEVIQLSDKDELKEALENLVAEQNRKLKQKDTEIQSHLKSNERLLKEKQQAYEEADECKSHMNDAKNELEKMKNGKFEGIAPTDRPDYNVIRECENQATLLYKNLLTLAGKDLSEFNEQMLGGVTMVLFQLAEDVRLTISAQGRTHFDRMYLTDEELENSKKLLTPNNSLVRESSLVPPLRGVDNSDEV